MEVQDVNIFKKSAAKTFYCPVRGGHAQPGHRGRSRQAPILPFMAGCSGHSRMMWPGMPYHAYERRLGELYKEDLRPEDYNAVVQRPITSGLGKHLVVHCLESGLAGCNNKPVTFRWRWTAWFMMPINLTRVVNRREQVDL